MKNILDIVDENDEIIGQAEREIIHRDGLLHREAHIFFITANKEIIFQHRAPDKDTYPDLLDATVGGHVEIGDSYEKTAVKETAEETGVIIDAQDLLLVKKCRERQEDKATNKKNNVFTQRSIYIFRGDIKDLKVEDGLAIGFEARPLDSLQNLSASEQAKFIPYILDFVQHDLADFIKDLSIA